MNNTCEDCEFYGFFDSGYGYCKRFPPQLIIIKIIPLRYEPTYPLVPFCDKGCGEFKKTK